ncbi:ABC transporter permease [Spiroplasma clarkii]|uniref:hypothetical protein n=1 Tax=Spiroplasma clarkii TaxID=2139 RepID=UPI000B583C2D|nr:hypothetical protein [Spiroplasma clarkii]ARU92214.1 ABC transporter permease [Spiroplasma clarkii]
MRNNLLLSYLQNQLASKTESFTFDRVEARNFGLSSGKTLKVFALNPEQNIDRVVVTKGMELTSWKQYSLASNDYTKNEFTLINNLLKQTISK